VVVLRQDPAEVLRVKAEFPECCDPAALAWWVDEAARLGQAVPMPVRSRAFPVVFELRGAEHWLSVGGKVYGPFASDLEAEHQLLRVMTTWKTRAHELGGDCVRPTKTQLVVTLPEDVPMKGGEELQPWHPKR
jgi:hypothetical protein